MATEIRNELAAITVNTGAPTVLLNLDIGMARRLVFQFRVEAQALSAFSVLCKGHQNAAFIDLTPSPWAAGVASDKKRIDRISGNLAAQAAASDGWFEMDVEGLTSVEIRAVAAVNGALVTPRWSLR